MIANVLITLIAAVRTYILVLQMFLWTKTAGLRAFGLRQDFAEKARALAANQGLLLIAPPRVEKQNDFDRLLTRSFNDVCRQNEKTAVVRGRSI